MVDSFDKFQEDEDKIDELAAQLPEELPLEAPIVEAVPTEAPIPPTQVIGAPAAVNPNAAVGGISGVPDFIAQSATNPQGFFTPVVNQVVGAYDATIDTRTGLKKPEEAIPQLQEGALRTPEAIAVREKVGEKQTSQITRTPEIDRITKDLKTERQKVEQAQKNTLTEYQGIAEAKQELDTARLIDANDYANKAQKLYDEAAANRAAMAKEIEVKRLELASMKPETFWGSKSAADKIMLALSVGLGAWGQAEIGGQNIGLELLKRNMDEHDSLQKQRFSQVERELSLLQNYSVQSQQAINNQFTSLAAMNLAQKEKALMATQQLMSKVSTASELQKLTETNARIKEDMLKTEADLERDLALKTVTTHHLFEDKKQAFSNPNAFIKENGEEMKGDEKKEYAFVLTGGEAEYKMAQLEDLNNGELLKTKEYQDWWRAKKRQLDLLAQSGAAREVYYGMKSLTNQDPELKNILQNHSSLQMYDNAFNQYVEELARKKSGAQIGDKEFSIFFDQTVPLDTPGSGDNASLNAVRSSRRRNLMTSRDYSGSGRKFYFEKAGGQ
jgi:hypothetical protein